MPKGLILASSSPRRYELLRQLGLDFDVIPSKIEEEFISDESPQEHVVRLAMEKALEVGHQYPNTWVIGADTIVYVDGTVLGKPRSREEALEMLRRLSGKEHKVFTGISVCHIQKEKSEREAVETKVRVKPLSQVEIEWYLNTGEPFDKAGGYGIQGIGSFMIESITGSYTNVVGLPLCELMEILIRLGAITISESGWRIAD